MYLPILILVAFAILFFRAATYERMSPWPWAISSVGLTLIVGFLLGLGTLWMILAQVGLFIVMTWYNGYRKERQRR
ncbi:MAG: hypothetical protein PVF27_00525 [Gemmatimonadales bacterium]|jgi:hypothetical protein